MTTIQETDVIDSIHRALQFISYYHPADFITALTRAYQREQNPSAKDAIRQMLVNSRLCALGKRPICQDTGIVTVFIEVGMAVRWQADMSLEDMVNEGVRRAYTDPDNILRASIVADPAGQRQNTGDNTPAVIHTQLVPGDQVTVNIAAKGGGSEAKARLGMLNPSDDIVEWVLNTVPTLGAGWCPPGILGIGIGGTAEKAMLLAKEACMESIDIDQLIARGAQTTAEQLRLELYQRVNDLGIGAQGLGGLTTVLDVKVKDYPTHAANKPVAIIPNCAATRHVHFQLDGSGPAEFTPPDLSLWPELDSDTAGDALSVDLNHLTHEQIQQWRPGQTLLLSGDLLTGRDAAHKRLIELLDRGEKLPEGVDFTNKLIYYVGPVDPVGDEVVGPAGPTTATRMDKFTEPLLAKTGLLGMIGKAERGPKAIEAIKKHRAVYLIAVGGAAYLVAKAIRKAELVAFEDLGMEAIYRFTVENMPVTVAVDSGGQSIHQMGPAHWRQTLHSITPVSD
ncbi:MAG: fumarate hydratase [Methylococcales bacterium]|nr:fumarate hydratase [Methylococcales bacterium]